MKRDLRSLYKSVILVHSKNPMNYGKNERAKYKIKAYNEICGDSFDLYFDMHKGKLQNLSFYGHGCTISKASCSVLVKHLEGKDVNEAIDILKDFFTATQGKDESYIEEFAAFAAAKDFPERAKCATLPWDEMEPFLNNFEK